MKKKRIVRMFTMASVMMLLVAFLAVPAYATGGNVSGAIEGTWNAAQGQIKDIVNNVVFPVIDMILAVLLFGGAYLTTGGSAAQEPESGDDTAQEPSGQGRQDGTVLLTKSEAKRS